MNNVNGTRAVPRITLDHNCIIALEEQRDGADALRELISLTEGGGCRLCVAAIGASELLRDGTYAETFTGFQNKLTAVGLSNAEILSSPAYIGLAFLGRALFVGDSMLDLERRIHDSLFPSIELDFAAYCAAHSLETDRDWETAKVKKWRNAKCDTLALWCHVWHHGDIFVTTDENFHKVSKKPKLIALGAGNILCPNEAVRTLNTCRIALL